MKKQNTTIILSDKTKDLSSRPGSCQESI